jgi:lipoate-protein ligase B
MIKQKATLMHWGEIPYADAWDKQESLLSENLTIKKNKREAALPEEHLANETKHFVILCSHPHVFTLGKSGHIENLLVNNDYLQEKGISFYKTNRGGDITYHGPGQIVGYPIFDLEKMKTDLVWYMRSLEEVIIRTLAEYQLSATRSPGETGVWLDVDLPHRARKICAMGVRTSRWVTMHGFALNVNTDLQYFNLIIPCGIQNKQVTSLQKELGREIPIDDVENKILKHMEEVFELEVVK